MPCKFGRFLKTVLFFSPANEVFIPRKQVCVVYGMDLLSIAHGTRSFNRIRIMGYETYRFQEGRYPLAGDRCRDDFSVLRQCEMVHPQVMFCVPKAWSVIQTTELPSAAKENLPDVVAYELDRITPFGSEDAFYDYRTIERRGWEAAHCDHCREKECDGPLSQQPWRIKHCPSRKSIRTLPPSRRTFTMYGMNRISSISISDSETYEGGLIQDGVVVAGCAGSFRAMGPMNLSWPMWRTMSLPGSI